MDGPTPERVPPSSSSTQTPLARPSAIILYGTETGTAQDLASEVGRYLEHQHFSLVDILPFDSVSFTLLSQYSLTVFVLATTGQGEFPSNARKFWTSLLRKKLKANVLEDVHFALVGLGSSSYIKFNWAARKLAKRVKMLGAKEIIQSCECDELADGSTESAFEEWVGRFEAEVVQRWPLPRQEARVLGNGQTETTTTTSKWILKRTEEVNVQVQAKDTDASLSPSPTTNPDSFDAVLESNDRVTPPTHWQDVRFLRLSTSASIDYQPGDCLAIHPENMATDVDSLLSLMDWHSVADTPLVLIPNPDYDKPRSAVFHLSSPLPGISCRTAGISTSTGTSTSPTTLRRLLTSQLDITAIPRRSFFRHLARFTTNPMHKERLVEFTNPEYLDEYYDYATRPRRSILEVLQEFDSVKLPWNEVCNIIPALRPRQFSICSGGNTRLHENNNNDKVTATATATATATETTFELLVAIVKYRTVLRKVREGVCTRYLAQLPVGSKLHTVEWKREGRFSPNPSNNKDDKLSYAKHLILIGAGTGIAPLRSLIQNKLLLKTTAASVPVSSSPTSSQTKIILFFGSRNRSADYFFATEWENQHQSQLVIHTAFSRDQQPQQQKIYVQDRIRQNAEEIGQVLLHDPTAVVIVCGASGQMPKAVRLALASAVARVQEGSKQVNGGGGGGGDIADSETEAEADKLLARMEKEGRYKQETWS